MANVDFTLEDIRKVMKEEIRAEVPILLLSFWEHNIEPAFNDMYEQLDGIKREMKGQRRIIGRHSKDIMELRSVS